MPHKQHLRRGSEGEALAREYLQRHGLQFIAQNYRCRAGELDLIMRDGHTLVFVEVRLRTHTTFGTGAETVDRRKQRKLIAVASHYLGHLADQPPCRFDVISITRTRNHNSIEWIANAFET